NFDGSTNILDIVSIVNFIVGLQIPTLEQECTADLNQDGEINVLDIVIIVNLIVGN
ncbi:MAG: dockerin type I domain-containing protein, partial [Fidelibacterota bacterium]